MLFVCKVSPLLLCAQEVVQVMLTSSWHLKAFCANRSCLTLDKIRLGVSEVDTFSCCAGVISHND